MALWWIYLGWWGFNGIFFDISWAFIGFNGGVLSYIYMYIYIYIHILCSMARLDYQRMHFSSLFPTERWKPSSSSLRLPNFERQPEGFCMSSSLSLESDMATRWRWARLSSNASVLKLICDVRLFNMTCHIWRIGDRQKNRTWPEFSSL